MIAPVIIPIGGSDFPIVCLRTANITHWIERHASSLFSWKKYVEPSFFNSAALKNNNDGANHRLIESMNTKFLELVVSALHVPLHLAMEVTVSDETVMLFSVRPKDKRSSASQ